MADANVSRVGQINQAGDEWALFLKQFGGELLTQFDDANVTRGKIMERNIQSGKSAQFPMIGYVSSGYHTPGNEITGQKVNHGEKVITIDGLLYADTFLDYLDDIMNHYEVRQPYAEEMGNELARRYDDHNFRSIITSARSGSIVNDGRPGDVLYNSNLGTDVNRMADAFWSAAEMFDTKRVPDSKRYGTVPPTQYYKLVRKTDLLNVDWGGRGSYARAELPMIANISVLKSNHLPQSDDTANDDLELSKYQINCSKTKALFWYRRAAGVVRLRSMGLESDWDMRRQGWLAIAKMAVGHGALRPDCAIEAQAAGETGVVGNPASKTAVTTS